MMDALAIEAAEAAVRCEYPPGAASVLIVELDGPDAEVAAQFTEVERLCRDAGAFEIRIAADDEERALIWKGRKSAFAAVGRISPAYLVQDGVIPRTVLPEVLASIDALSTESGVRVANVFHAGDGNLHPLVLFDDAEEGAEERAETVSGAILDLCIEHGGSITGEHGVGVDKARYMPRMFTDTDLDTMQMVRCGFDPAGCATRARSSRRRGCAARCPANGRAPTRTRERRTFSDAPLDALAKVCADVRPGEPAEGVLGVEPALVAAPKDLTEAADVMRVAAEKGLVVVPRGAETRLDWGTPPERCDLLVDTHRLSKLIDHTAGDLVAKAEAGLSMDVLGEKLRSAVSGSPLTFPCPAPRSAGRSRAAPPVRSARCTGRPEPGHRDHGRPGGRAGRPVGRQGRQERRRVRPGRSSPARTAPWA